MKRVLACLLLAVAVALGLAACGDSDSSTQATDAATQPGENSKPKYEGGEKSIEEFGSEAGGSERASILAVEQSYLGALADEDYGTACSHLADPVQQSLQQLVAKQLKAKDCSAILPVLLAPTAAATARDQANGKVTKVRVEGDRAFVVFHAPGAKLYVFTMQREDDAWKATTVAASVLVPSAATLGSG